MTDITSLRRAADILHLYSEELSELGPSEVSRRLNINKVTVIRLMSTMISANLLQKSANGRKYRLNSKIMDLAWAFVTNADIEQVAMPYMEELRRQTNEGIVICKREGDYRVCTVSLESSEKVRIGSNIGEYSPLQAGSPGTVILAGLPDDEISQILERIEFKKYTKNTITSKKKIWSVIGEIRKQGVWTSVGEYAEFAYAVSAPVRDYTCQVIASLSINGIEMRLTEEKDAWYKELVKEAAINISHELGYWKQRKSA